MITLFWNTRVWIIAIFLRYTNPSKGECNLFYGCSEILFLYFLMYFFFIKIEKYHNNSATRKKWYIEVKSIKFLFTSLRNRCQLCFNHVKTSSENWINNSELVFKWMKRNWQRFRNDVNKDFILYFNVSINISV